MTFRVTRRLLVIALISLACLVSSPLPFQPRPALADVGRWTNRGPSNLAVSALVSAPNYTTDHTVFVGTETAGVFVSSNRNQPWIGINTGLQDTHIRSLAISPAYQTDGVLFAGADHGVFKSTDRGNHWSSFSVNLDGPPAINALALPSGYDDTTSNKRTLFVGASSGVFRSSNGGSTWAAAGLAGSDVAALAVSPVFAFDHSLAAAVRGGALFTSSDSGATWTPLTHTCLSGEVTTVAYSPDYANDAALFVGGAGGLAKLDRNGCQLTYHDAVYTLAFSEEYLGTGALYLGGAVGVFASHDRGATWEKMSDGLGSQPVHALLRAQSRPTLLWAGTSAGAWDYTIPDASTVKTLILTNRERLVAFYGAAEADAVIAKLYNLASYTEAPGLVLDLGNTALSPTTATAYAAWVAQPTSANANAVAAAVGGVVQGVLQQYTNTKFLVIVGGDTIVPFYRTPDETSTREGRYRATTPLAPSGAISTTVSTALDDNFTLTDDYYASRQPTYLPQGGVFYAPSLAVGRLVETPADIRTAIDTFLANPNIRTDSTAFVSGADDYLLDSATAMANAMKNAGLDTQTLISNTWGASDERAALLDAPSTLVGLNQHGYHDRLVSPQRTAVTAQDIATSQADMRRALIIALACHAGLNIPDAGGPNTLDLPQVFARKGAAYVGNTGFGWAVGESVGLTEALANAYINQLLSVQSSGQPSPSVTIGEALRDAKRRYYLSTRYFDAYDEKVVNEFTLYGLPMFKFTPPPRPTPAAKSPDAGVSKVYRTHDGPRPDGVTPTDDPALPPGLTVLEMTINGQPMTEVHVRDGVYYKPLGQMAETKRESEADKVLGQMAEIGGGVEAGNALPLLPKTSLDVTSTAGALKGNVTGPLSYRTVNPTNAVTSTAIIPDAQQLNVTPDQDTSGWYPAVPQVAHHLVSGAGQVESRLVFSLGQVTRNSDGTTVERLVDQGKHATVRVYYSWVEDETPPVITDAAAHFDGDAVVVSAAATDPNGEVWRVTSLTTDGRGEWVETLLTPGADGRYTGRIPVATDVKDVTYWVQAVDQAGNTAKDVYRQVHREGSYQIFLPHLAIKTHLAPSATPTPTPVAPTPTATATAPAPTPTATPTATPVAAGRISGRFTLQNAAAPQVAPWLRLNDGADWRIVASTLADGEGRYHFDAPPLAANQTYQVWFANLVSTPGELASWLGPPIPRLDPGGSFDTGSFDLADIALGPPDDVTARGLPVTFSWTLRAGVPTAGAETYSFHLFDITGASTEFVSPDLGQTDHYVLTTLPSGFSANTVYGWDAHVHASNGEGEALGTHKIVFRGAP
ncbi:MAG: C25 family cysteine peptidase [Anaerolineae bacterium]